MARFYAELARCRGSPRVRTCLIDRADASTSMDTERPHRAVREADLAYCTPLHGGSRPAAACAAPWPRSRTWPADTAATFDPDYKETPHMPTLNESFSVPNGAAQLGRHQRPQQAHPLRPRREGPRDRQPDEGARPRSRSRWARWAWSSPARSRSVSTTPAQTAKIKANTTREGRPEQRRRRRHDHRVGQPGQRQRERQRVAARPRRWARARSSPSSRSSSSSSPANLAKA